LPPYAALLVFFAPMVALFPVKVFGLWLIGEGRGFLGVGIIVVAKVAGTAVVARLFMLTHPALMQLPWFARLYGRWTAWKGRSDRPCAGFGCVEGDRCCQSQSASGLAADQEHVAGAQG
jgi:hypothetical protein